MPTPWEDSVKNRNPKQLTIFVAPTPDNATKPEPDGDGGADVQFDTGNGDLAFTALGQDHLIKNFSGAAMHGNTQLIKRQFGSQPLRIRRAFVFVPETPMVSAQMRVGRDKFNDVQREAGHGIKHFIAAWTIPTIRHTDRTPT